MKYMFVTLHLGRVPAQRPRPRQTASGFLLALGGLPLLTPSNKGLPRWEKQGSHRSFLFSTLFKLRPLAPLGCLRARPVCLRAPPRTRPTRTGGTGLREPRARSAGSADTSPSPKVLGPRFSDPGPASRRGACARPSSAAVLAEALEAACSTPGRARPRPRLSPRHTLAPPDADTPSTTARARASRCRS